MLLRMTISPIVYQKMRKLYGKHVDDIQVYTRAIKDRPGKFAYSATCDEHGVVSAWITDLTKRTLRIREHLQGVHD